MYKNKEILALIPARGGSKGLPRKNIIRLLDKPLIAWTIEQALESRYLDDVIVSTDDTEIAEIAGQYGAKVPFMRPAELASDTASSFDVIKHAIDFMRQDGKKYDCLMLLEPTSPLRETKDIDTCIERLVENPSARSIVGIAPLESGHPEFNVVIDDNSGSIRKTDGTTDFNVLRRQDLKDVYFFEGTIYLSCIETLLEKKTFYHDKTMGYVVPRWKSLEIDEKCDLICAEALLKARMEAVIC